jgi:antitoxin VapB
VALNLKNPEAEKLAKALARKTGETLTDAVINALRERLSREEGRRTPRRLEDELLAIGARCAALPDLDRRSPDEIIGYDEVGLPK